MGPALHVEMVKLQAFWLAFLTSDFITTLAFRGPLIWPSHRNQYRAVSFFQPQPQRVQKLCLIMETCPDLTEEHADNSRTEPSVSFLGKRCIGIDYGLKRTGVCVSVGFAPRALPVIHHNNQPEAVAEAIVNIAKREAADNIIVGFPINSRGAEGEQANCTRAMVAEMARRSPPCPILLWDERHRSSSPRTLPALCFAIRGLLALACDVLRACALSFVSSALQATAPATGTKKHSAPAG